MLLSKLLGLRVIDAGQHPVGTVIDVRLTIAGDPEHNPPTPSVLGLVISPRTEVVVPGIRALRRRRTCDPCRTPALAASGHVRCRLGGRGPGRIRPGQASSRLHPLFTGAARRGLTATFSRSG